ncbi:P-loop containing nucleoside triphosphate hydrolase protein, partial [Fomitopsis serialis]|uniref:P-loop containing nucleoside triphosphate hydrolase protein n=1 Tax=Fomitopsis serialis TaxID=139415 RepID=UPI002007E18C
PTPTLRVKRVDHFFNRKNGVWTYKDTKIKSTPQVLSGGKTSEGSDIWQSFCFVVVREFSADSVPGEEPAVAVTIKSPYLRTACKDVIGEVPGLSWTVDPLELPINLLIRFFPQLTEYHQTLQGRVNRTSDEEDVLASLDALLNYLREDHGVTISQIADLLAQKEITSDLLYAILIPETLFTCRDDTTGEPLALQLKSSEKALGGYALHCEGLDTTTSAEGFGRVKCTWHVPRFKGVVKINTLPIYPMRYHSDEGNLRRALLARARKWVDLNGVHHVQYEGTAVRNSTTYEIDSRVMIDRGAFKRHNPKQTMPEVIVAVEDPATPEGSVISHSEVDTQVDLHYDEKASPRNQHMADDELILASPVLYGFSLSDKLWLKFNVEKVQPIEWSNEPFTNLVLSGNRRDLLRSLVEAHNSNLNFDDFVKGKGQGLVINLFGPPGVGKTLSAEATSEHLRRPLYMIGGGDLGESADAVDANLKRVFSMAARWRAIVLIDEADVFLEQRAMNDLSRNAMVAVFLRHVEYYRGILFLTTNRVKAFDQAFLSRIHVALRFQELSKEAKYKIWQAFLLKVGSADLTADELDDLVSREVNGRQIKNATRTATSLAQSRGEKLGYRHLSETLDAMEEFDNEFKAISQSKTV